ncbi:Hypothetical protein PHPALM_16845 [Phytophthora palmivora]|uniref:CCHC-type domain-containing protein n=1 Tax=Phytophthora palmivora TaxID=4796 RepID=A0A2P4XNR6_9STRA|nr:Hypothetical protein PHPALM_16845 [Phytophthora palmivora]
MGQTVKYEMSHFGGERKPRRERPERKQPFPRPPRSNVSQAKKPFQKRLYNSGHYAPAEQTKSESVCFYCKKPGHFKRDCNKLKKGQETKSHASRRGTGRGER